MRPDDLSMVRYVDRGAASDLRRECGRAFSQHRVGNSKRPPAEIGLRGDEELFPDDGVMFTHPGGQAVGGTCLDR